jgi:hypothetical protein
MPFKIIAILNKDALTSELCPRSAVQRCGSPTLAALDAAESRSAEEGQMVCLHRNDRSTDRSESFRNSLKGPEPKL